MSQSQREVGCRTTVKRVTPLGKIRTRERSCSSQQPPLVSSRTGRACVSGANTGTSQMRPMWLPARQYNARHEPPRHRGREAPEVIFTRDLDVFYRVNHREMIALAARVVQTQNRDYAEEVVQQFYLRAIKYNLLAKYNPRRSSLSTFVCMHLLQSRKGATCPLRRLSPEDAEIVHPSVAENGCGTN